MQMSVLPVSAIAQEKSDVLKNGNKRKHTALVKKPPTYTWYSYDWNTRKKCGSYILNENDKKIHQVKYIDYNKNKQIFTIEHNFTDDNYVSLTIVRESVKDRECAIATERQRQRDNIKIHSDTVEKLEKQFDEIAKTLILESNLENIMIAKQKLDSICLLIGKHKFDMVIISNSLHVVKYLKRINKYIYHLPCNSECELIIDHEDDPKNIVLSWFSDNDHSLYSDRTKIRPIVVETIQMTECLENIKLF